MPPLIEAAADTLLTEHERYLRLRERDILDCLTERERQVWTLFAICNMGAATIAERINAREGAGTVTETSVRVYRRNAQRKLRKFIMSDACPPRR